MFVFGRDTIVKDSYANKIYALKYLDAGLKICYYQQCINILA